MRTAAFLDRWPWCAVIRRRPFGLELGSPKPFRIRLGQTKAIRLSSPVVLLLEQELIMAIPTAGPPPTPPPSAEHVRELLSLVNRHVPLVIIRSWSDQAKAAAADWAAAPHSAASDNPDVELPPEPEWLKLEGYRHRERPPGESSPEAPATRPTRAPPDWFSQLVEQLEEPQPTAVELGAFVRRLDPVNRLKLAAILSGATPDRAPRREKPSPGAAALPDFETAFDRLTAQLRNLERTVGANTVQVKLIRTHIVPAEAGCELLVCRRCGNAVAWIDPFSKKVVKPC